MDIFSRYYRVDDGNSKVSGLGIGLYICKEIVSRHNGRIWADKLHMSKLSIVGLHNPICYLRNMNRLILIGNGFDLAHGLKTSYKDFIHAYMHRCFQNAFDHMEYEDPLIKIKRTNYFLRDAEQRHNWVENYLAKYVDSENQISIGWGDRSNENQYYVIDCKSALLDRLLKSASITNWVDTEGIFYIQNHSIGNAFMQRQIERVKYDWNTPY